ncbi:MAG: type I 3-dehydroquinate dehydratase, partial [Clostridiales bacterium]|nr:type I 3-dehydroquinate dehydratase [Clostridiales bacterium]
KAQKHFPDVIEWRADYTCYSDPEKTARTYTFILERAEEHPVIFTYRKKEEGGTSDITEQNRIEIIKHVIVNAKPDIVDIEYNSGEETVREIVELAHANGVKVIVSWHSFSRTPWHDELIGMMRKHRETGADIVKFATMPESPQDPLQLLGACSDFVIETKTPTIAVSLGETGKMTRVCGGVFGSCMTFASLASSGSAPGQIDSEVLPSIFREIYN